MTRSVTIVTGYVPLASHPRPMGTYLELGRRLLQVPVRKIVWTTREIAADLEREHGASCQNAFPPFDGAFWVRDELRGRSYEVASQHPAKDTLDYHVIQHQKTRWLAQATRECSSDVLVWIDFGIFHLPGITAELIADFAGRVRDDRIAMPGCWPAQHRTVLDHPNWRFCGSVVVCPAALAPWLHLVCVDAFRGILDLHRKVSWEVNTWAVAESTGRLPLRQYHATTHDARMFTEYDGPPST